MVRHCEHPRGELPVLPMQSLRLLPAASGFSTTSSLATTATATAAATAARAAAATPGIATAITAAAVLA